MPRTRVVFYRDDDGSAPAYDALEALRARGEVRPTHGQRTAVLSHLITKRDRVPDAQIDRAIACKGRFEADPGERTLHA